MSSSLLLLAIHAIPRLAESEKLALAERAADADAFCCLSFADVEEICGRRLSLRYWNPGALLEEAAITLRALSARGIRLLGYHDPEYPPQLREIFDPPFLLFCRGLVPAWDRAGLAIVGTRYPSGAGRRAAWETAREAAENGIAVVSGLARGIDAEAHRGCLNAGGKTIAVLGNGADTVYPASHRALASRILEAGGLLLTEYAPGAGVRKYFFPARNRIISGLCRGVLVAEAPAKSGALITADYALQQGRDLYVHELGLAGPSGEGTRRLAEEGAPVIDGLGAIVRDWGCAAPLASFPAEKPARGGPGKTLAFFLEKELTGSVSRSEENNFEENS
ncbi:MAG: DNA-processing protein DprA [Spirochaetaceae bacterium]|nr:DNA-processing protein DprA [Spirochaetaceae bacterium]